MSHAELLTEAKVAQLLSMSVQKLQRDRWSGKGIPFIKVGRCVRYRPGDVDAYLESRVRTDTSKEGYGA